MEKLGCSLCLSTAIIAACVGTLWLQNATGTSDCSSFDFPCENGECIDAGRWCDSILDCSDGSDEKYCKTSSWRNRDPNKCPITYFRCTNGPCIPAIGRCDGYENCEDKSDEKNCEQLKQTSNDIQVTTPMSITNYHTTSSTPTSKNTGFNATSFFASLNASQSSIQMEQFSVLSSSALSRHKNITRTWLLSQRKGDFGWGEESPRAITALYISGKPPEKNNYLDMLMIKQLEMQLLLELAKNETNPVKLTDLALYINALLVSCKSPKNFYGKNLVSTLRDAINSAQLEDKHINPSIYLTLCLNNDTTSFDVGKLHDILSSRNYTIDMQSLALLSTACIFRKSNFLNSSMYDSLKMEFLRTVKVHGFPENVYEAALLFQALQELQTTLTGLFDFILKQQESNGSFGDLLSAFLVLPIFSGRNLVNMNEMNARCGQRNTPDLVPLEEPKNDNSRKMHVQYSLHDGFPPEVIQTIQMHVAEGTNFLNVMKLAQEINPKYRFKMRGNREFPIVYSISGIPNDVFKGMYWTLYKTSVNCSENSREKHWEPYIGDIKELIPVEGDEVLFWYRPL